MNVNETLSILAHKGVVVPPEVQEYLLEIEAEEAEALREAEQDSWHAAREEEWAHGDDRDEFTTHDKNGVPFRPRYNDAGEPNFWGE